VSSRGSEGSGPNARAQRSLQEATRRAAEQAALRRRDRRRLVVLVVVLVLALVGGGIGFQAWRTGRSPSAVPATSFSDPPQPLTAGQPIRFGDPAAPVELALYADYHCPHCVDFEAEFGPTLTAAQAAGRLRLAVFPMSFVDAGSAPAANAVACAAQASFGERYHRGLFANARLVWSERQLLALGTLSTDAAPVGFSDCVSGGQQADWAEGINAAAAAAGVTQTPTLLLDGAPLPVEGLTPESLQTMIDAKG
jgi:protein-disulfide isomerase